MLDKDKELSSLYEYGAILPKTFRKTEQSNSNCEDQEPSKDPFQYLTKEYYYSLTETIVPAARVDKVIATPEPMSNCPEKKNDTKMSTNTFFTKRKVEGPLKSNMTRKKMKKL